MQRIVHRDEHVDIDGNGFSAIGRLELNQFLQNFAPAPEWRLNIVAPSPRSTKLATATFSSAPMARTLSCAAPWKRNSNRKLSGSPIASLGTARHSCSTVSP